MTTATIVASWSGRIYGSNATYSTARSTSAAFSNATFYAGQQTGYIVQRGFLKFDTSILAGATISQVNLRLVCVSDNSATDFDAQIIEQDWSASDAISDANREAVYDACLAAGTSFLWRNTSGMSTNTQYTSANLTTGYVNKTGNTYYSFRSSRDYANNTPTGNEILGMAEYNHATESYRPALIVEYTMPATGKFFFD